ncbi:helix-turn-helix domain-containing protein [Bacillus sp. ISL-7]|uniref:helix-turn-helix domain-containing protein n=1 Tax=Bacillus sp. ISL-7 TaxID=2819136 RepID=UPI001BEA6D9B|nr:helix-turn-helix domain-containing protein [Bacillus sp. ISL-7]MBT2734724.1 helix-turn-helix domain-containing protein [Bacillus sp. ISL-7]
MEEPSKTFIAEEIWQILKEKGVNIFNIINTLYIFLKKLRDAGFIKGKRRKIAYLYDEQELQIIINEIRKVYTTFDNGYTAEELFEHFSSKQLLDIVIHNFRNKLKALRDHGTIKYTKIGNIFIYDPSSINIIEGMLFNRTLVISSSQDLLSAADMWRKAKEENLTRMNIDEFTLFIDKLRKAKEIIKVRAQTASFYSQSDYEVVKKKLDELKDYLSVSEVWEELKNKGLPLDLDQLPTLIRYLRKQKRIEVKQFNSSYFLTKGQYENLENYIRENSLHLDEDSITSDFYDVIEAAKLLNYSSTYIRDLCNDGRLIGALKYKNNWMIPRSSIQTYKVDNESPEYLIPRELAAQIDQQDHYIIHRIKNGEIKAIEINKRYYIPLDEAQKYLQKYSQMVAEYTKQTALAELDEYFESLKSTIPVETHNLFKNWSSKKITDSGGRAGTLKDIYLDSKRLYNYLLTKCNGIEVFDFDEIKLLSIVNDDNASQTIRKNFVYFNKYVLAKKGIVKSKVLVVDEGNKERKEVEKEIYTPEIYDAYYRNVQKVDTHTLNAVEDQKYANMWVYVIMLLTNIWRGNDIIWEMPEVDIDSINVTSFNFFKSSTLSTTQVQTVINDMYLKLEGSVASKNKAELRFYVDPTLDVCFATALVISEIHRRKYKGKQKHKSLLLGSFLLGYRGQAIDTTGSDDHLKFFGKETSLMNFKSLVMNRSTALYLFHHILEEDGEDSDQALEMVKKSRSHKKSETTAIYVESKNRDGSINRVSLTLFRRGHFGWLYNSIVKLATQDDSKNHNLEKRTELIRKIRESKTPLEIEKWSGFLLDHSRIMYESTIMKLIKMPKNDLLYLLYKIFRGEMPSKEREGQCLTYPACEFKQRKSCFGCFNFIPQQMVLIEAANQLRSRVKKLRDSHMYDAIRIRESMFIDNLLFILSEAKQFLGKEKLNAFILESEVIELLDSVGEQYLTSEEIEIMLNQQSHHALIER